MLRALIDTIRQRWSEYRDPRDLTCWRHLSALDDLLRKR